MMYTTFAYNSNEMRVSELITNISYFELLGNYIWIIVNKKEANEYYLLRMELLFIIIYY